MALESPLPLYEVTHHSEQIVAGYLGAVALRLATLETPLNSSELELDEFRRAYAQYAYDVASHG